MNQEEQTEIDNVKKDPNETVSMNMVLTTLTVSTHIGPHKFENIL